MQDGLIFNIQRFCTSDGPGIRTTVFLLGCPLRCAWCHNPESQPTGGTVLYTAQKCLLCGACASACPTGAITLDKDGWHRDPDRCTLCGACAKACRADAIEAVGRRETVEAILDEVMRDEIFYRHSGGGMTLSGGEPLLQSDFTLALLRGAKERGLHTALETSGFASRKTLLSVAEVTDLFLFDYKLSDPKQHRAYVGVDPAPILDNLRTLDSLGARIILRCPILPELNGNEAHLRAIGELAESLPAITAVELEPYHALGESKYGRLGLEASRFTVPDDSDRARYLAEVSKYTGKPVRIS